MGLGDGVEASANRLEVAKLLFVEKRELSFTDREEVQSSRESAASDLPSSVSQMKGMGVE